MAVIKVLMIAPRPFFINRGFGVKVYEEYCALTRKGVEVTVAAYRIGRDIPGVKIVRSVGVFWYQDPEREASYDYVYLDVLLFLKVFAYSWRNRPDILHCHIHEGGLIGVVVGKILGIPVLLDTQDFMSTMVKERGLSCGGSIVVRAFSALEGFINRNVDGILSWYKSRKELIQKNYHIKAEKIYSCQECVDNERFSPQAVPDKALLASLHASGKKKVIGFLGLLLKTQGIEHLLEAAQLIIGKRRDVSFLIMGFPHKERYEQRARDLGIERNCLFTGSLDYLQAPAYLAACDILVSPKFTVAEGNGKLLNYMAMGIPIVAYDTPVNREILGNDGVYAPLGDVIAFSAAILSLLDDDGRRRELGAKLRERSLKEFSTDMMANEIIDAYQRVRALKKDPK